MLGASGIAIIGEQKLEKRTTRARCDSANDGRLQVCVCGSECWTCARMYRVLGHVARQKSVYRCLMAEMHVITSGSSGRWLNRCSFFWLVDYKIDPRNTYSRTRRSD